MRRALVLLVAIGLHTPVIAAQQLQAETPTPEYQAVMKSMASIAMKSNPARRDYEQMAMEAAALKENFATLEAFWTAKNADDALAFVKAGSTAAGNFEAAANAQDDAAIASARTALASSCLGCHVAHVKRLPDSTLAVTYTSGSTAASSVTAPRPGVGIPPASGGEPGDRPYRPGNGVTPPQLQREVKPQYTAVALRLKAQGSVWLECIVERDGSVGDVKVVRSLDPVFGLDDEAVKAARQWKFLPGLRAGEAVRVSVTIQLSFTLR